MTGAFTARASTAAAHPAERLSVPADLLFPLPDAVDERSAAASLHSATTAVVGLGEKAALKAGETILVTAGSGNVGHAVIALAKRLGAVVLATAGNAEKAEYCRELDANKVLNYRDADWLSRLRSSAPTV